MANRAAGAGYESQANYPYSRLEFYNIPNIHVMRDSLKTLSSLLLNPAAPLANDIGFTKLIEDSQWLTYVRLVIKVCRLIAIWHIHMAFNKLKYVYMYIVGILGGSKSNASLRARVSTLLSWMGPHGAGVLDSGDVSRPVLSYYRWFPSSG